MSASNLVGEAKKGAAVRTAAVARLGRWPEETGLVVVFLLMILAIGIPYPEFLSFGSIKTVLRQSALIGIIAFGMVFRVAMVEPSRSARRRPVVRAHPPWIASFAPTSVMNVL